MRRTEAKLARKQEKLLQLLQPAMTLMLDQHKQLMVQIVLQQEVMELDHQETKELLEEILNSLQPPVEDQISRRLGQSTAKLSRVNLDL